MAEKYVPSVSKTEGKFPRAGRGVTPGMTTLLDEETKQPAMVQPSGAILHSLSPPQHLPTPAAENLECLRSKDCVLLFFFNEPFEH